MAIPDQVYLSLDNLLPDDVGEDYIQGYRVCYEGFTDECDTDAEDRGMSYEDLEQEILNDWKKEGWTLSESGWDASERIFYAIYEPEK